MKYIIKRLADNKVFKNATLKLGIYTHAYDENGKLIGKNYGAYSAMLNEEFEILKQEIVKIPFYRDCLILRSGGFEKLKKRLDIKIVSEVYEITKFQCLEIIEFDMVFDGLPPNCEVVLGIKDEKLLTKLN